MQAGFLKRWLAYFPNAWLALAAIAGLEIGLVTSKALLSVATITLMCNALVNLHVRDNLRRYFSDRANLLLLLVLVLYLLSGLYSGDKASWVDRCRMKLPYLALPLGFSAIRSLSRRTFRLLLALFFWIILLSSLAVYVNYLAHFAVLNQRISQGKPLPCPMNDHIRFSIEIAFAIVAGAYLFFSRGPGTKRWQLWALGISILFLIYFIHVLAVRSGLVALYLVALFWVLRRIVLKRTWLPGLGMLLAFGCIAWAALHFIPSLQEKLGYFEYEMRLIRAGEMNVGHDDAQRLLSIQFGWKVGMQHPLFGVGMGDLHNEIDKAYHQVPEYALVVSKLPHNEFVFQFAGLGITGVIAFLLSLLYPWFARKRFRSFLLSAFMIILISSLFSEHTLEIQIGTAFYLLFLLMIKTYLDLQPAQSRNAEV